MGLRKFMDNIKPTFSKGGKLGFLESTFDAFETFLFVPNTTTSKGAHIRDCNDMKRTMIVVTHEMNFARDVADRVIYMADGRVVEDGPAQQVLGDNRSEAIRAFAGESNY